jgi:hypothetical protein
VPATLGRSALLGRAVTVSPAPGSMVASAKTQISMLGVPAAELTGVKVTGSVSGSHPGRLAPYSQGDGASFLPARPFVAGEHVTVRFELVSSERRTPLAYAFTVAVADHGGAAGGSPRPASLPRDYQRFHSRPDLRPPTVDVTTDAATTSPGDLLLAPYSGPGQYGPMILDEHGGLLWFKALSPPGTRAADLRVQSLEGQPVLTYWQDPLVDATSARAGIVILNSAYEQIATVRAGNGYQPDLHEFQITPRGTALLTVYDGLDCNLRAYGGPAKGAVADTLMQELDLETGLVRFEWHSLDHVPMSDSHAAPRPAEEREPWDYFHINSVAVLRDGSLLIDARNTWAAYDVDPRTGQIAWRLGGKRSSFKLAPGAAPAWQHDAREQANGNITFFDNGATPKVHAQSRVIELALNRSSMTATLARGVAHSPALVAGSQGNLQVLPDGGWMVGWGQVPYLSEYDPSGRLVFDAHLPATYESYRVFRQSWTGQPHTLPSLALLRSGSAVTAYASWNGATAVASWRVLSGASPSALSPLATTPRRGFETAIALSPAPAHGSYVVAQALDASGAVLGSSAPRRL